MMFYLAITANFDLSLPSESGSQFAKRNWLNMETTSSGVHKIYYSLLKKIRFLHSG